MRPKLALSAVIALATALVLPLGTASAQAATGTTYHVDCSARTNGTGTGAPWNSLDSVTAHGPFAPGDKILLKRGSTCHGRLAPQGSGTHSNPITIGAYGSSKAALPTVSGGGTAIGTGAVQLVDAHDWTIQDLHVTNKGRAKETDAYRAGVLILNNGVGRLPGLKVQRLRIDSVVSNLTYAMGDPRTFGGIAAVTNGTRKSGFDKLQILNNRIDHVGRTGIAVLNRQYMKSPDLDVRISGNTISWPRGDSIVVIGSRNARIDHNVSAHGAAFWPCKQCGPITPSTSNAAIWTATSSKVHIDHNEVYGEHFLGGDGEAFDIDNSAHDTVVEYNYAHDNQGGGILFCGSTNATARFNIFQNNRKSAFAFIGNLPAKNTQIYNNTVYNSSTSRAGIVRYFNGAHGGAISLKNNLLYSYSYSTYWWPTKKLSTAANTLIGHHGAGRPTDSRTSWVDPRLKKAGSGKVGMKTLKGYKPKHPSSMQRGVAIPKSVKVDFFGKRINPKKPPRGAAA